MSKKLSECCDRFRQEIMKVETYLADVRDHLSAATEDKLEPLEARWKAALARCDAERKDAQDAGRKFRQFVGEKKAEVISRFEDWKTDREIEKLEQHADKLEDQAANAVAIAAFALLEAEVSVVEALKARKIAVEVAG